MLYDFQKTGPQEFRGASTNAVWATADFIENNPDVVEAFARSIAQADAWLQDPANAEEARAYFAAVAGADVPDELLEKLLVSMKAIVGPADLEAYAQLLDDPAAFEPATALSTGGSPGRGRPQPAGRLMMAIDRPPPADAHGN